MQVSALEPAHIGDRRRQTARARRLAKKAVVLASVGRYEEAIHCQSEVATLRPHDPVAFHRLGLLYREVHRYGRAVDAFRCATALDPEHSDPREALVDTLLDASRYTEAIAEAKSLLRVAPKSTFARYVLSVAYFQLGLFQLSLDMTTEISGLDPYDYQNFIRRGTLFQNRGEFKAALNAYGLALDILDPESAIFAETCEAIEGMDDQQIRVIVLLASEDRVFGVKLMRDPQSAVAEKEFALSRDGLNRLTAFSDVHMFELAADIVGSTAGGSRFYN